MEKVNILMLYSAKGFGGLPRNLSLIASNLNYKKFRLVVVRLGQEDDEAADIRHLMKENVDSLKNYYCLESSSKFNFANIKEIKNILEKEEIAILSCHGYKADIYGFIAKYVLGAKVKLFTIIHGWVSAKNKLKVYNFIDKVVVNFFDKVIFVNSEQKNTKELLFLKEENTEIINNAVDLDLFERKKPSKALMSELGIKEGSKVIGYVGRLAAEKNVSNALEIFAELKKSQKNAVFVIAGEGAQRQALEEKAKALNIKDSVHFAGYIKDIKPYYSLFNIYLSCSRKEGLPNTVLEAMASGVPCVLSNIPGHKEVVEHEKNGFLFKEGDISNASKFLKELLENDSRRREMRDEARKELQKKFSIKLRISKLEKAYLSLVKGRVSGEKDEQESSL